MTKDRAYELAYNAHERAECAALDWETRGWMSAGIIDRADDVLTVRLNAQVAA